jgi:pSer/pThr/pTyr-binding forkhead associated (FHA) protein
MSWSSGLQVRVIEGPDEGSVLPLNFPKMTIGRARTAGSRVDGWVLLMDRSISRRHAELLWDHRDARYVLHHLSQTNFTWVNDVPLETEIAVEVGTVIQMGGSRIAVEILAETEPGLPARESIDEPMDETLTEKHKVPVQPLSLRGAGTPQLKVLQGRDEGFSQPLNGLYLTIGRANLDAKTLFQDEESQPFDQVVELSAPQIHPNHLILKWDELKNAFLVFKNPSVPDPLVARYTDGMKWEARLPNSGGLIRLSDRIFFAETLIEITLPEKNRGEAGISPVPLSPSET